MLTYTGDIQKRRSDGVHFRRSSLQLRNGSVRGLGRSRQYWRAGASLSFTAAGFDFTSRVRQQAKWSQGDVTEYLWQISALQGKTRELVYKDVSVLLSFYFVSHCMQSPTSAAVMYGRSARCSGCRMGEERLCSCIG